MKSKMLKRAFDGLQCSTGLSIEGAKRFIQLKKDIVNQVNHCGLLGPELLGERKTVYVSSFIDVRFPLCLGSRKIDMVDPCFHDPENILRVTWAVEEIIEAKVVSKLAATPTFEFPFDFGYGQELVTVRCLNRYYAKKADEGGRLAGAEKTFKSTLMEASYRMAMETYGLPTSECYVPDGPIGLLLGFNTFGVFFDECPDVINSIVSGGFVLSSTPLECLALSNAEFHRLERRILESPDQYHRVVSGKYKSQGKFKPIPIRTDPDLIPAFSFLQKI